MGEIPENMVSVREVPWHKNATIVEEKLTAREALILAKLDWDVTLEPVFLHPEGGQALLIPGRVAVTRSTDSKVFQICSEQYQPIQNWKSFEFFDDVIDSGDAKYDAAGDIGGGKKIFLTALIDRSLLIGDVDPVRIYLMMANSHDGSLAFTAAVTPVRVCCENTLNLSLNGNPQQWKLKHHEGLEDKADEARKALGLVHVYADDFQKIADELIAQEFQMRDMEEMLTAVIPHKGRGRFSAEHYAMLGVFESSPTVDNSFRKTKWGALNAVREWDDWGRTLRKTKDGDISETQLTNTWFGPNVARSNKVLQYLRG